MIEISNLTYRYNRSKTLFEKLTISLQPGKVYGLLGKNGAGKSSLIKNIAGLLIPAEGFCILNGLQSSERSADFYEKLFFLPEESELPGLPIPDFLKIYAPFYPDFNEQEFYTNLEIFHVDKGANLQQLSFGQKKKAYIAFSLAVNTPVLIMDEPTNGLDIPSKIQFRKMVAESNRENRITIMSTHQVRDLDDLITTVLIMDNSQVLLHADKQEIMETFSFMQTDCQQAIYKQETATGVVSMVFNQSGETSYLDLEVLFNAVLNQGKNIEGPLRESKVPPPFPHTQKAKAAAGIQSLKDNSAASGEHLKTGKHAFPLLLRRQYQENKRLYGVAALALAGTLFFLFFITWHFRNSFSGGTNQGIFLIGLFLGGSILLSTFLKDLHQPSRAVWLMALPASVNQKLLIAVLYGIVLYPAAFLLIFFLTQGAFNWIVKENMVQMEIRALWKNAFYDFYFTFVNIQLLVLLGSLAFRKAAFIKSVIMLLAFFLLTNTNNNNILKLMTGEKTINGGGLFDYFQFVHNNENVYIYLPGSLQSVLGIIFHFLVPIFIYYIIYLKFREKEI